MTALDYPSFTKAQKIAAFLIIIGPEAAGEVLRRFDNAQVEAICREMAALQFIDEDTQRSLMEEFSGVVASGLRSVLGGADYTQSVLSRAKDEFTALSILDRVAPANRGAAAGGADIREMDARQIFNLVKNEQPQTMAFILSHLDKMKAAEFIMLLPAAQREEVIERLGAMEETSRETVDKIANKLSCRLDRKSAARPLQRSGGVQTAAEILNLLKKETRNELLAAIEERDQTLGLAIRKKVFSFDDLQRLQTADLQRVFREVETGDLAVVLKGAKPALVSAVLSSMSKRAAESLKEEIEILPQSKPRDVEAAQNKILQIVRKLEESEEITIDFGGGDDAAA